MSDPEDEGLGSVVGRAVELLVDAPRPAAAALVVGTGLYTAADVLLEPSEALRATGVIGLVTLYLQLLVTARALNAHGQMPPEWDPSRPTMGRYPRAFVLSLVSTLAIFAGLILLVVPGIVLLLRWSLAYPAMLAEDEGVGGSLRRSWNLTRGRWSLLLPYGGLLLCLYVPALALPFLLYPAYGRIPLASALVANLAFMAAAIFTWLLAASLYVLLRGEEPGDGEPS